MNDRSTLGLCVPLMVCRVGGPGVGRKIALDVARGLTFLHSNRIAHMDLKTLNGAHLQLCCLSFLTNMRHVGQQFLGAVAVGAVESVAPDPRALHAQFCWTASSTRRSATLACPSCCKETRQRLPSRTRAHWRGRCARPHVSLPGHEPYTDRTQSNHAGGRVVVHTQFTLPKDLSKHDNVQSKRVKRRHE